MYDNEGGNEGSVPNVCDTWGRKVTRMSPLLELARDVESAIKMIGNGQSVRVISVSVFAFV